MNLSSYVQIKHSPRARRLALRLDPKERIINLIVPRGVSEVRALSFAAEQQGWIMKQISKMPKPISYENGTTIPILGQNTNINIVYDSTLKRTSISLQDNELLVSTNKEDPSGRIQRFLKNLAHETIEKLSREKAIVLGKRVKSITLRDTKSRWGSCSSDGKLSFSWRLIHAPYESLDYVVAHEVAHLKHMDHSPRFWATCEKLSSDYEDGKGWMRDNAHQLMRYGT
jgi:predicted metal-dependent hydrolase